MSGYSQITVKNEGAFTCSFRAEWANPGSMRTPYTGSFPVDKQATIDLTKYNITAGEQMRIELHVDLGKTIHSIYIPFDPTGPAAVFIATNGVQNPAVSLTNPILTAKAA